MSSDLSQTPTRRSPYQSTHNRTPARPSSSSSEHMYDDGEDMDDFQPIGGHVTSALGVTGMGPGPGHGAGMQHTLGRPFEEQDMEDDEQTPIVPESAPPPASSLPSVPGAQIQMRNQDSVLASPFRNTHSNQSVYHQPPPHQLAGPAAYYAPPVAADARYAPVPAQQPVAYPQYFVDPYTGMPTAYVPVPAPAPAPSTTVAPTNHAPIIPNATTYAPVQYGPASGAQPKTGDGDALLARPKVKLTHQDKRNIVQLHRANSSLRQEDIARQYGVDRSTISKIILQSHRWAPASDESLAPVSRMAKAVCGRFPAVEQRMHEWMDRQIAQGLEVRDATARDQAKEFAKEAGFPSERFKASAKWLDKFKARRREQGKPTSSLTIGMDFYTAAPGQMYPGMAPMGYSQQYPGTAPLSRSHSNATLSSGSSEYMAPGSGMTHDNGITIPHGLVFARSDTDLAYNQSQESLPLPQPAADTTPTSRQRSQSSPHNLDVGVSPSSGKVKPTPLNLQRQNSFHGYGGSRRPTPLSRSNTANSSGRRSRPGSLAASAFGITPLGGDEPYSPHSPASSGGLSRNGSLSGHSRGRSGAGMTPFADQMGIMTISPGMDTPETSTSSASSTIPMPLSIPPLTPMTPGHGHPYAHTHAHAHASAYGHGHPHTAHYAHAPEYTSPAYEQNASIHSMPYGTMPNKHYASPTYVYQHYQAGQYEATSHTAPVNHTHGDSQAHLHHPQPMPHLPAPSRYSMATDFGPAVPEERWQ